MYVSGQKYRACCWPPLPTRTANLNNIIEKKIQTLRSLWSLSLSQTQFPPPRRESICLLFRHGKVTTFYFLKTFVIMPHLLLLRSLPPQSFVVWAWEKCACAFRSAAPGDNEFSLFSLFSAPIFLLGLPSSKVVFPIYTLAAIVKFRKIHWRQGTLTSLSHTLFVAAQILCAVWENLFCFWQTNMLANFEPFSPFTQQ